MDEDTRSLPLAARIKRAQYNVRLQEAGYQRVLKAVAETAEGPSTSKHLHELSKATAQLLEINRAEEVLERLQQQGAWAQQRADLVAELAAEYGDRGPQYALLIARAADAEVRARQLSQAGRPVDAQEWRAASKGVLEAVQALQRYTESEKREVLHEAQQKAMLVVLEIAERVVAPEQPLLWDRVLEAIQRQLPEGTEVA